MDLLFKRYASPFLFVNGMIQTGQFADFVIDFIKTVNEETNERSMWEFFLHKVNEGSFADFKAEAENNSKNQNMSEEFIETTVSHSLKILNNFNPEKGGGDL